MNLYFLFFVLLFSVCQVTRAQELYACMAEDDSLPERLIVDGDLLSFRDETSRKFETDLSVSVAGWFTRDCTHVHIYHDFSDVTTRCWDADTSVYRIGYFSLTDPASRGVLKYSCRRFD